MSLIACDLEPTENIPDKSENEETKSEIIEITNDPIAEKIVDNDSNNRNDYKSVTETLEENASNLNEDSECFFDTIEDNNQNLEIKTEEVQEKIENLENIEVNQANTENTEILEENKIESTNSELTVQEEIVQESLNEPQPEQEQIEAQIEVIDFQTEWSQLTDNEKILGLIAPAWLPDNEAENCMKCGVKFSFRKDVITAERVV